MDRETTVNDPYVRQELRELREDVKEFTKEIRATLRVVTDPITGYVPRSEIDTRFKMVNDASRFTLTICVAISGVVATLIAYFIPHR